MNYLEETRGIDPAIAERYGVQMRPMRSGGEAVTINYRKNGEVIGHKVRPLEPGDGPRFFFSPTGAKRDLWNVDVLADASLVDQPVIVTEGELDAMSCIVAGFPRAVSIPDGWTANFTGDDGPKSRPILDNADRLKRSPFVVIAGDADETGGSFVRAAANMLDGHPCKFLDYPPGCKDANDVLRKFGPGELARVLNAARWIDPEGGLITGFADLPPEPPMQIFRTGDPVLDKVILFHAGFPTIITGIPSSGKSTFAVCALHETVRNTGVRVGIGMFETPASILRDHLCRLSTCQPWDATGPRDRDALVERLDRNWRVIHKVEVDRRTHDMAWIRDMMQAAAVRDGCKIVTLDPWNEIEHLPEKGESMTDYVNVALARIRQWAERFDCAVCIVAHPTKMQAEAGMKPRAPLGYDISSSAAWFNKAAIGVTIHQVDKTATEDAHVLAINWKSKFQQQYGITKGKRELIFDTWMMAYRPRPVTYPSTLETYYA